MRRCKSCGNSIEHLHHNCVRCTNCQREHRRATIAKAVRKYRKQRGRDWYYKHKLGTSDFGPHRNEDIAIEQEQIKNELRRLGLRENS